MCELQDHATTASIGVVSVGQCREWRRVSGGLRQEPSLATIVEGGVGGPRGNKMQGKAEGRGSPSSGGQGGN